jgi:hypothetical protein
MCPLPESDPNRTHVVYRLSNDAPSRKRQPL